MNKKKLLINNWMRINEILMKSKIIKYNKILNKYHNEIN